MFITENLEETILYSDQTLLFLFLAQSFVQNPSMAERCNGELSSIACLLYKIWITGFTSLLEDIISKQLFS